MGDSLIVQRLMSHLKNLYFYPEKKDGDLIKHINGCYIDNRVQGIKEVIAVPLRRL